MKNEITVAVRTFPLTLRDERTGEEQATTFTLSKTQLQAAQIVGESSKELIWRLCNRQGYRVVEIGKPTKREIKIDLSQEVEQ